MTIVELLITTVLMGISMAAIGELVVLNTFASTKLSNSVDGQLGCSRAIRRIAEDVRRASLIGTIDGTNQINNPDVGLQSLGSQILILQQPTYFQDASSNGAHTNLNGFPLVQENSSWFAYDTVIYFLIPDTTNVGTYQLQCTRIPGVTPYQSSVTSSLPALNSQVILTGIIGPSDRTSGNNNPAPFVYLHQANGNSILNSPAFLGVSINFEVQNPVSGRGRNVQHAATHAESYLKSAIAVPLLD